MHTMGYLLTLSGAIVVYLSHSNQMLLEQPFRKTGMWGGAILLLIALVLLFLSLPKAVALLTWLILPITVWSFMPFIGLANRGLDQ